MWVEFFTYVYICMYVHICMYVNFIQSVLEIYTCICLHVYACMHAFMYVCVLVCMFHSLCAGNVAQISPYIALCGLKLDHCMYVCVHVCRCIPINTYEHVCIYMYIYICMCICICIYIFENTHNRSYQRLYGFLWLFVDSNLITVCVCVSLCVWCLNACVDV
jgi:hypothetical protein